MPRRRRRYRRKSRGGDNADSREGRGGGGRREEGPEELDFFSSAVWVLSWIPDFFSLILHRLVQVSLRNPKNIPSRRAKYLNLTTDVGHTNCSPRNKHGSNFLSSLAKSHKLALHVLFTPSRSDYVRYGTPPTEADRCNRVRCEETTMNKRTPWTGGDPMHPIGLEREESLGSNETLCATCPHAWHTSNGDKPIRQIHASISMKQQWHRFWSPGWSISVHMQGLVVLGSDRWSMSRVCSTHIWESCRIPVEPVLVICKIRIWGTRTTTWVPVIDLHLIVSNIHLIIHVWITWLRFSPVTSDIILTSKYVCVLLRGKTLHIKFIFLFSNSDC